MLNKFNNSQVYVYKYFFVEIIFTKIVSVNNINLSNIRFDILYKNVNVNNKK